MTNFFTLVKEEVCLAWMDFHSIGHFIMGQLCFAGTYLVLLGGLPFELNLPYSLISSIIFGVLFEVIENGPCVKLKFAGRKDSVENSVADIVLVILGAIFEFVLIGFASLTINIVLNTTVFVVLMILYLKLRMLTC